MKLQVVILTIVISMMTERQVEAASFKVVCYENKDLKGFKVTITNSIPNIPIKYPNKFKAFGVTGTVIFYARTKYEGDVSTFHGNGEIYVPPPDFVIKSFLILGSPSNKEGIFLFKWPNFRGGLYQQFSSQVDNVQNGTTFQSVAVVGGFSNWTVKRKCYLSGGCPDCFKKEKSGTWASFVSYVWSYDSMKTLAILPGVCSGDPSTGVSKLIPCKCNRKGVYNRDHSCTRNGQCNCVPRVYTGKKCYKCDQSYRKDGRCVACNCPWYKIVDWRNSCNRTTGYCICKPPFTGRNCEICSSQYPFKLNLVCLTKTQNGFVKTLKDSCTYNNVTKSSISNILTDFMNKGYKSGLSYLAYELKNGLKSPKKAACDGVTFIGREVIDI